MNRVRFVRKMSKMPGFLIFASALYYAGYLSTIEVVNAVAASIIATSLVIALLRAALKPRKHRRW